MDPTKPSMRRAAIDAADPGGAGESAQSTAGAPPESAERGASAGGGAPAEPVDVMDPRVLVGSVLDGRYRILDHLATGGMGSVFRAEHVYMSKTLALKVLRPELAGEADIAERFRREAQIAASLEHDNIVRVTDFGVSPEGILFLAMEML